MLRYAISDGQFALCLSPGREEPRSTVRSESSCHSPANQDALHRQTRRHGGPSEGALYFTPEPKSFPSRLLAHAASVAARNIDFFLLREPSLRTGDYAIVAREILKVFANTSTRLLLHSRADIAAATGAKGVHLPSEHSALTPEQVRLVFASANCPRPTISLSCHTAEDLLRARETKPDLILFGPVFGKSIHGAPVQPGIGLEALRAAAIFVSPIPVLALGGITEANTPDCLEAGAAGVAAIRLFQPVEPRLPPASS